MVGDPLGVVDAQRVIADARCACRSYNRPETGGTVPETLLPPPEWDLEHGRGVPVDSCIAGVIEALWAEGVHTLGSCCGHNGAFGPPHVILADGVDPEQVRGKLARIDPNRRWAVKQWQLVTAATT